MASTTYKTLISSDFSLDADGINGKPHLHTEDMDALITICRSEGHQVNGIMATFSKYPNAKQLKKVFFIANYTETHEWVEHETPINIKCIPIPYAPFSTFSKWNGAVNTEGVIEPTKNKESKIGFIYYGARPTRDIVVSELFKHNLTENLIYHSNNKEPDLAVKYSSKEDIEKWKGDFHKYQEIKSLLPITKDDYRDGHSNYYPTTIEMASQSLFYIVHESNVELDSQNVLTEKSAVPFYSKSIPLFFTKDSLSTINWFENLGFDLFQDIIPKDLYKLPFKDRLDTFIEISKNTDLTFFNKNTTRFQKNYELAIKFRDYGMSPTIKLMNQIIDDEGLKVINII